MANDRFYFLSPDVSTAHEKYLRQGQPSKGETNQFRPLCHRIDWEYLIA
jgi:hypothetical protein